MRCRRLLLLVLLLLAGPGCSSDAQAPVPLPGEDSGVTPQPTAPKSAVSDTELPPAAALESATAEGRAFQSGWSIAFWDEEEGELIIGFLEAAPTSEQLQDMKENNSLFMGVFLDVPMIEFAVSFEKKNGEPDVAAPTFSRALFNNFGEKGPMTLNRFVGQPDGWLVEVSGNPRGGGHVKGRFEGTDTFSLGDDKRDYSWNFTFDLPVQ